MTAIRKDPILIYRIAVGGLIIGGLTAYRAIPVHDPGELAALTFFAIVLAGAGFALVVRGLGAKLGTILGAATGIALAWNLTRQLEGAMLSEAAILMIAGVALALLGRLSGSTESPPQPCGSAARPRGNLRSRELACIDLFGSFARWVETDACMRALIDPRGPWAAFDQFLRQILRELLGAGGVRNFHFNPETRRLDPLTRASESHSEESPPRFDGLATFTERGKIATGREGEWTWLLPVLTGGRPCGLVAIARLAPEFADDEELAQRICERIQLFWAHLRGLEKLGVFQATDRQSGVLTRTEFLRQLSDAATWSARIGEPLVVAAITLEGLRWLDDHGLFETRDRIVQTLGETLLKRMRSDDVLGRFCDDRFIIVMRRLDLPLGRLMTEKLLENIHASVIEPLVPLDENGGGPAEPRLGVRVRAGLAGSTWRAGRLLPTVDAATGKEPAVDSRCGVALLERALARLEQARRRRLALVADSDDEPAVELTSNRGG